jgi:hypothetical protein
MTTVVSLKAYIGKRGIWSPLPKAPEVRVNVRIKDAATGYGRIRLLVEPVSGDGEGWVEASAVEVEGVETPARKRFRTD